MTNLRAKVKIIYDEFRDAELNKEYYSERILRTRKKLRSLDVFLALFAAGSGVFGFSLWGYEFFGVKVGQISLGVLSGIAIVIGTAKPYLKLEDELERLSAIQGTYDSLSHILKDIVNSIKANQTIDITDDKLFSALRQIRGGLGAKEDKPADRVLIERVQNIVNTRHPTSSFWWP